MTTSFLPHAQCFLYRLISSQCNTATHCPSPNSQQWLVHHGNLRQRANPGCGARADPAYPRLQRSLGSSLSHGYGGTALQLGQQRPWVVFVRRCGEHCCWVIKTMLQMVSFFSGTGWAKSCYRRWRRRSPVLQAMNFFVRTGRRKSCMHS